MKKILLSILSIFFCLGMLTGGAIMLSGCNSSSYSKNNHLEKKPGGGFDDSQIVVYKKLFCSYFQ